MFTSKLLTSCLIWRSATIPNSSNEPMSGLRLPLANSVLRLPYPERARICIVLTLLGARSSSTFPNNSIGKEESYLCPARTLPLDFRQSIWITSWTFGELIIYMTQCFQMNQVTLVWYCEILVSFATTLTLFFLFLIVDAAFSFLRFVDTTPAEAHAMFLGSVLTRFITNYVDADHKARRRFYAEDDER